jgi:uncharacterized membrane protein
MNNIFYYFGIAFILIEVWRTIGKKKLLAEREEIEKASMESVSNIDVTKIFDYAKKHGIKAMIGFLNMGWQIIGMFSTPESRYFIAHFVLTFVFAYLPMFTKDKNKKYEIEVVGTIISVLIIGLIMYSHFINNE